MTGTPVRTILVPLFLLALPAPVLAEQEIDPGATAVESASSGDPETGWQFRGFFLEEYRGRATSGPDLLPGEDPEGAGVDEQDHDLRLFVDMNVLDPDDHFRADVTLAMWVDADGYPDTRFSGLRTMRDYDKPASQLWLDAYVLSAEYHSDDWLRLARGGRQVTEYGDPVTFDGGTFVFGAKKPYLDVFVFGGRTHHFFETDLEVFEDYIAACGAVIRPMADIKIEVEYRFLLEEVTRFPVVIEDEAIAEPGKEQVDNHIYSLTAWYNLDRWLYLKVKLQGIDEDIARAGLATKLTSSTHAMGLDLSADVQTVTLRNLAESPSPFHQILGDSLPYVRWRLDMWKDYYTSAGDYGVHIGWDARELIDGDEGPFNRNVGRIYFELDARDIVIDGPFLSGSVEASYTRADGFSDDLIFTAGGSAGWDDRTVKAEIGTYYQRYKYDYYATVNELSDVRTYFGAVSYRPLEWLTVKGRYEFELADRDVHNFTLALSQTY